MDGQDIVMLAKLRLRRFKEFPEFDTYISAIKTYTSDDYPAHMRDRSFVSSAMHAVPQFLKPFAVDDFVVISENIDEWECSLGYRSNDLTYQEHKLIASTELKYDLETMSPYDVLGIHFDGSTVAEMNKSRSLRFLKIGDPEKFKTDEKIYGFTLEPLFRSGNRKGQTKRDPRPLTIDKNAHIDYIMDTVSKEKMLEIAEQSMRMSINLKLSIDLYSLLSKEAPPLREHIHLIQDYEILDMPFRREIK